MFMYPIFITDDPTASVEIPTLPGQRRWGVDRLEEFLGPLVKKGLSSVILFGVPLQAEKVISNADILLWPDVNGQYHRMNVGHQQMTLGDP
jgi:delta-aminolevulinic acid dehydratase/porphobilinogen synthase